ncbi:DUF2017 family protein [Allokutzneria albata]|uniref:Uncharacterized protein n=1 Tax=Allokutzneria albata TaxID=211114 RepID=A0A1G9XWM8_ALLAB|nr:DUF2017 family protein [Allokutzneria albata]SDN00881.1 protein of unknown function [Allokutzneria albata]
MAENKLDALDPPVTRHTEADEVPAQTAREGDRVLLRLTPTAAATVRMVLRQLLDVLESGTVPEAGRGPFGRRVRLTQNILLRRMFPAVSADPAISADFRARHEPGVRAEVLVATRRVLGGWTGVAEVRLEADEFDDWMTALGAARFLFSPRKGTRLVHRTVGGHDAAATLTMIQDLMEVLVHAACPDLAQQLEAAVAWGHGEPMTAPRD